MEINYPNEGIPKLPPIKFGPWLVPVLVLALLFMVSNSLFYQIGPDEVGVVQRFGKYVRTTSPGLHFKWPFGVDDVSILPTRRQQKIRQRFQHFSVATK